MAPSFYLSGRGNCRKITKLLHTENGAERRTYFVGSTELVITATGNRIWRRQIAGVAIAKIYPRTQVHQVAYLHRDHLGSVEAMSDEAG